MNESETRFDAYAEDVPGRANVRDTPELVAYYRDLESKHAAALWTVANKIEPWEPQSQSVPMIWRVLNATFRSSASDLMRTLSSSA